MGITPLIQAQHYSDFSTRFIIAILCEVTKGVTMSEDETVKEEEAVVEETPETNAIEEPAQVTEEPKEEEDPYASESLRNRFRLTGDEEILMTRKPSFFAFIELYVIAVLILGIHLLFGWADSIDTSESNAVVTILVWLLELSELGNIGVVMALLLLTWLNRMFNLPGSNGWVTTYLLLVSLTPLIIEFEDIIITTFTDRNTGYIPLSFNYTGFGILWCSLMIGFTLFYQNSFQYAITNHRVIYTQHLFIPGDGRRILYDNIREIRTQRTALGSILGYVTIITDTGNQLEIVEEGMSVSVGSTGSEKGLFKKLFAFLTYTRTSKIERPDAKYCFYQIRNWRATENLLNEMHQKHSQSGVLSELKEKLENVAK